MGIFGDLSPGGTITIGILVGLISTSVQSLGLTLQRKSHMLEDEKFPLEFQRPAYRRRRWQLGMGMFIFSNIVGSTIQISTLPLPVLSTLQAAGLVFNSVCATLILGEPFTRWSFYGTVLVTTGAALIAIFGAIPSPAHSLPELLDLLGRWPFILWMSLQGVLVVSMAVVIDLVNHLSSLSQNARFRLARGLIFGCISGILSAHSLLFAKSAVELVIRTIADGDNQFVHWESWMLVFGLVSLALSQLYYLHRGLKLISTSVLYPLVFCIYNIIAILDGLIYFNQTNLITPLHGGLIALGTVILLSGVLALSWRLSDEQHPPAVGQSTLAPGLGLVDDTEGEESSPTDSDSVGLVEEAEPATYNTFAPNIETTPLTPGRKPPTRWHERSEIWDELEDQDTSRPLLSKSRSVTIPVNVVSENTPLMGDRRLVPGGSVVSLTADEPNEESPRKNFRHRRKSTGFPGFTARKHIRRKNSAGAGVQDTLGGIWKLRWWRGKRDNGSDVAIASSPGGESERRHSWVSSPSRRQYQDDPEDASERRDSNQTPRPKSPRGDDAV
ncbi:uncharacterized protein F4812DRAFT_442723 [Daldinia caldariorum]|uniref:uncharacterized protein n=1 Tax=Daldinia caldariorum TaxID=326644 RepID=UPI0020089E1D|nr:uncharacterized protein F4812DRAFT_442723 [Daldinia caldariorum]KAI1464591.1 hypothetical protein F4812DRAFT_442723 [Daldinia caldariorum]